MKALIVHDWSNDGIISQWTPVFTDLGWEVIERNNPTKEEYLSLLADPEVMAVCQTGHGSYDNFHTGSSIPTGIHNQVWCSELIPVLQDRPKMRFVFLDHCDALDEVNLDGDNWVAVFSKGSLDGIAIIGLCHYSEAAEEAGGVSLASAFLFRFLPYVREITVGQAYDLSISEYPKALNDKGWGIVLVGDKSIKLYGGEKMVQFPVNTLTGAVVKLKFSPANIDFDAELYLSPDGTTKGANSVVGDNISTGEIQEIVFPITMPASPGEYFVKLGMDVGGVMLLDHTFPDKILVYSPEELVVGDIGITWPAI